MKAEEFLPLTETSFFILLSLATTPKHGYGIIKEVESLSAGRVVLAAGTLYSALRRMLEDGWIEELDERPDPALDDERRRYYRLNGLGERVLDQEARRLEHLVQMARQYGLSGPAQGSP